MEFIVDTFDKATTTLLAAKLNGEVVNEKESLVIVDFACEQNLTKKVKSILETDVFRITKKK